MHLKRVPFYLLLLPVFFVLHAFVSYYGFVPLNDAVLLIMAYSSGAILIAALAWFYFKSIRKAALIAFILMGYYFFFGYGMGIIEKYFSHFIGYTIIFTSSFLVLVTIIVIVKWTDRPFYNITSFLNLLLILFLVMDIGSLVTKMSRPMRTSVAGISKCDNCNKPDVYFIILDEYTSNIALKEKFNFDNSVFINELEKRGFYVARNSTSNYHSTPYSLASILNMNYLDVSPSIKHADLNYCYRLVRDNAVVDFFESHQYKLYNYSIFDVEDIPTSSPDIFLPRGASLVTRQTLFGKLYKEYREAFTSNFREITLVKYRSSIENLIDQTKNVTNSASSNPRFVYTHLMMPHFPYYYDSTGNSIPVSYPVFCDSTLHDRSNYTSYLKYCNKRVLEITDHIISHSSKPPLIILAGDHGFRDLPDADYRYKFMNLQAVLLPSRSYKAFYDGSSAVNLFRIVLNTEFQQKLPLLTDTLVYLKE